MPINPKDLIGAKFELKEDRSVKYTITDYQDRCYMIESYRGGVTADSLHSIVRPDSTIRKLLSGEGVAWIFTSIPKSRFAAHKEKLLRADLSQAYLSCTYNTSDEFCLPGGFA